MWLAVLHLALGVVQREQVFPIGAAAVPKAAAFSTAFGRAPNSRAAVPRSRTSVSPLMTAGLASAAQPAGVRSGEPGVREFRAASADACFEALTPAVFMVEVECDVAIVGGGPAGCACALYTSRADLKTVIIDKNPSIGALAITSHIANYPGAKSTTVTGKALLDDMREMAVFYGAEYHKAQVFMVEVDGECKTVYTPDATFKARALVLATGAMGRKPGIPGEEAYLGRGVSYCATCDGAFYRDSEVAVVGRNMEAIDEAEFLTKFASTVHWIHAAGPSQAQMSDEYTERAKDLLAHPNVKHWSSTNLKTINGDDDGVTGVTVQRKGGEPEELPVEGVFVYVSGSTPITDFLENQVETNPDGGVKVDDGMMTSVDGVYGIGDIRNTPFKQVVVAASDGCIAAMSIDKFLKKRKTFRVDWIHK
jgi:thioredoxin reductase (NADPH)